HSMARHVREQREQGQQREDDRDGGERRGEPRRELAPRVGRLELRGHDRDTIVRPVLRRTSTRAATLKTTVSTKRRRPTSASAAMWSSFEAAGNSFAITLDMV